MKTYVLHQVNCQGAFGAGFAAEIAKYFPEAKQHYMQNWQNCKLGDYLVTDISEQFAIVHLFGQEYYGNAKKTGHKYTNERALEYAIREFLKAHPGHNYICPKFIGCGLAGGNWNWVEQMLNYYGVHYSENINLKEASAKTEASKVSKRKKITDYCIIDHIGSIEDGIKFLKELYKKAYSLSISEKTFTITNICKMKNPNVRNLDAMKNSMRMSLNPKQVIIICTNLSTADWVIKQWLERCNDVTIIHAPDGCTPFEIITGAEFDPTIFQTWEITDSKARRCASIWANALDYTFSAPLYRDPTQAMNEGFMTRPDKEVQERLGNHSCKISTKPEKFRATKTIASEEELNKFWEYYKYLYMNNLLAEFISPSYHICPHCGRPIHENAESCQWCDTRNEFFIEEFESYYDTEELESWD